MYTNKAVTKLKLLKVDKIANVNCTADITAEEHVPTLQVKQLYNQLLPMQQPVAPHNNSSAVGRPSVRTTQDFRMTSPRDNTMQLELLPNQQLRTRTRWRSVTPNFLTHSMWVWIALCGALLRFAGVTEAAAVVYDQEKNASLGVVSQVGTSPMPDKSTGTSKASSYIYEVKLPSPVTGLLGVAVSPSTAHLHWSDAASSSDSKRSPLPPGQNHYAVGPTGQPVVITAETDLAADSLRLLAYYIERDQRSARLTLGDELLEDGLRPSASCNVTICVRRLHVVQMLPLESDSPRLPLLSMPICATGLRGLPLAFVKPLYVASFEIVALSLVVSVITCICVHYALERLKIHLRSQLQEDEDRSDGMWMGSAGYYNRNSVLNRRMRNERRGTGNGGSRGFGGASQRLADHDAEMAEPDERSRIITLGGYRTPLSPESYTTSHLANRAETGAASTSV